MNISVRIRRALGGCGVPSISSHRPAAISVGVSMVVSLFYVLISSAHVNNVGVEATHYKALCRQNCGPVIGYARISFAQRNH